MTDTMGIYKVTLARPSGFGWSTNVRADSDEAAEAKARKIYGKTMRSRDCGTISITRTMDAPHEEVSDGSE